MRASKSPPTSPMNISQHLSEIFFTYKIDHEHWLAAATICGGKVTEAWVEGGEVNCQVVFPDKSNMTLLIRKSRVF